MLEHRHSCFSLDGVYALLVQGTSIAFDQFTHVCTSYQQNFTGAALTMINTADLGTVEEVCSYYTDFKKNLCYIILEPVSFSIDQELSNQLDR